MISYFIYYLLLYYFFNIVQLSIVVTEARTKCEDKSPCSKDENVCYVQWANFTTVTSSIFVQVLYHRL